MSFFSVTDRFLKQTKNSSNPSLKITSEIQQKTWLAFKQLIQNYNTSE